MSDAGRVFHTERLREEVFELRERYAEFFRRLKAIPHLRLPLRVDLPALQEEVSRIEEWCPIIIESDHWNAKEVEIFAASNYGRALIEFLPDSRWLTDTNSRNRPPEFTHYRSDGRLQYFDTDLLREMPATRKLIYSICDYPTRVRVTKTPAGYRVPWHTHHKGNHIDGPYYFGVIQVPISTGGTVYSVKSWDTQNYPEEFHQVYEAGEAYVFNSYHLHAVQNPPDKDRIALFMTFNLEYEPMIRFLEPYVFAYEGPIVSPN